MKGYELPQHVPKAQLDRTGPGPNVRLHCDDCGSVFPSVPSLAEHTTRAHGRGPHRWERTPK